MEKVRPWILVPSDREWLKEQNRTEQLRHCRINMDRQWTVKGRIGEVKIPRTTKQSKWRSRDDRRVDDSVIVTSRTCVMTTVAVATAVVMDTRLCLRR